MKAAVVTKYKCVVCGGETEWDFSMGDNPICLECWDQGGDQEHKDEVAAYQRRYYQEHKDEVAAYQRRYRQEHKDEVARELESVKC